MTFLRIPTIDPVDAVTRRLLMGFAAALGVLAAQAASAATLTLQMQAPKDYFSEQCLTLERGQQLAYQVSTRHPIEFNLHHHPANGPTVFPDRLTVKSQHSKQLVAELAGEYCFMATNVSDQSGPFNVVIAYEITAK